MTPTTSPRCFALERVLVEDGPGRVFDGEVTGLIGAGAFIAFAAGSDLDGAGARARSRGCCPCGCCGRRDRAGATPGLSARRPRDPAGAGRAVEAPREGAGEREWWELNEEGTILRGERTGAALRLGDRLHVHVGRVDAIRGRVDLEQAG